MNWKDRREGIKALAEMHGRTLAQKACEFASVGVEVGVWDRALIDQLNVMQTELQLRGATQAEAEAWRRGCIESYNSAMAALKEAIDSEREMLETRH